MVIIYIIGFTIFFYLGSILAKYFYLKINQHDFYSIFSSEFGQLSKKYLRSLIINYSFLKRELVRSKLKNKKYKDLVTLSLVSEIFGGVILGIMSIAIINSIFELSGISFLIYFFVISFFSVSLLYLAIYDIVTFTIPENIVKSLCFAAVLVNLVAGLIKIFSRNLGHPILLDLQFGTIGNLVAGVGFAFLIWIIVKITKEKGMGEGDVYLVLIIGLILGWPLTLISFLSTLILGSLISIAITAYFRKIKGVIVPFVPFLLLGFIVALTFGSELYQNLFVIF